MLVPYFGVGKLVTAVNFSTQFSIFWVISSIANVPINNNSMALLSLMGKVQRRFLSFPHYVISSQFFLQVGRYLTIYTEEIEKSI